MKKILITGGTVFVSRYIAEFYIAKGYDVYVLNRNTRTQPAGATLIQANRHHLNEVLRNYHFNAVIDVTAYTANDINLLLDALENYDNYIFISSSAVYPEHCPQPFTETTQTGPNKYWGNYGTDKIKAEEALMNRNPNAYILRPPYLYGPMNNVYREAFVFDCALKNRKFYLPGTGDMKLQFFHVQDLCRFLDIILTVKPEQHIFNVGNKETVSIREWVGLCYQVVNKQANFVNVLNEIDQRNYFSFYNYEYYLDVTKQYEFMHDTKPFLDGLRESYDWYKNNSDSVNKKPFFDYIDNNISEHNEPSNCETGIWAHDI